MSLEVICPYCGKAAELVGGDAIYPHRADLFKKRFWLCRPCDAYVGTHEFSRSASPLGRLANAELRAAKMSAHRVFDPLWKKDGSYVKELTCADAYAWLAGRLGIPLKECHIGGFDIEMCKRVVGLCSPVNEKRPTPLTLESGEV